MKALNYKNLTDQSLTQLIKTNDQIAFNTLYQRYTKLLISFVRRRIPDDDVTKDIVQNLFVSIWEKREQIDAEGEIRSYIFLIAKNKVLDYFKHAKVTQEYINKFQKYIDDNDGDTDYKVRHNDLQQIIENEINKLPVKMRTAFLMSRREHLSRKQISEQLGIPEETVNSRIKNALRILRDKLPFWSYIYLILFMK